jgi:flagellar hook-length control protein FliK
MRPVSDGSLATIVPQNLRTGDQSGGEDFSSHLRNKPRSPGTADKAVQKTKAEVAAKQSGEAKDTSADTKDTPADPTQPDSVQWLAAQMLAFKTKEPVQTVQEDGSIQTTVKTSIVTLPKAALEQGAATADGVPTLDPQTGLLVMKPVTGGTTGDKPTTGDLPVDAPPTDVVETPPVDKPPTDQPDTPVAVDPGAAAPPVDPPVAEVPKDPAVVDPATDPSVVDPAATDPTLVAETMPTDPLPPADGDILPTADDPTEDGSTPGVGQSRLAAATAGSQVSMGRASDVSSGSAGARQGGDLASGSQKDDGATDAQSMSATPAPTATIAGVTAPPMQVQLAVPADRQLVPSIGAEVASTAQGMSALERVIQANDQAQASTPVMKVLNVQLSPADLGNVSMRLSLEGTSLDVHMSVDQGRTRSLIERDRHMIADSLAKVGYSVGTLTIEQTSASSNSNMSSAGQSFTSNSGYDGSSGRQPNHAGNAGGTQGQGRQGLGFMDGDGSTGAIVPARVATSRGVFV